MLVISRRTSQQIQIGDRITITVVAIQGNTVRVGIEAPKEVTVHRKEVAEEIERRKRDKNE